MHILNMMSTVLTDFFNRNEKTTTLKDYGIHYDKDEMVNKFEKTADIILKLKLKQKSIWYNKSNSFSLIIALAKLGEGIDNLNIEKLKTKLEDFEKDVTGDYKLASTEGVNNKKKGN